MKNHIALVGAAVAGAAAAAAFAPLNYWWLMPPALALLFYLILQSKHWRVAAVVGFVFGLLFFGCGLRWIYGALSGYIGLPTAAALLIWLLLCAALSLYPALVAAAARRIGGVGGGIALGGLWALAEWLRGRLFGGFPWLAAAYSQTEVVPVFGWLPVLGIAGANLILAFVCAIPVVAPKLSNRRRLAALAVMAAVLGGGTALTNHEWTRPVATETVSLLQGNVAQNLKWREGEVERAMNDYLRMAAAAPGRLIVLPETALPMRFVDLPPAYVAALRQIAVARRGAVLAGGFVEEKEQMYNAAVAIGDFAAADYRKRHLTPYGEYLPFAAVLRPLLLAADIPYNSLAAGEVAAALPLPGMLAAVSICYEDAFGDEWRTQLPQAQVLINITNDGWFDGSPMALQHRQMSQARAAEFGRWLVRATNTGRTAIIDHRGRVVVELAAGVQETLNGEVTLREGATPFVRWGEWPALILSALLIAGGLLYRRRQDAVGGGAR